MVQDAPPVGKRFSQVYLTRPELLPDSVRMRRRIGLLVRHFGPSGLYSLMNRELGTNLSAAGSATDDYWPRALENVELRDALDVVTLVARYLDRSPNLEDFISEARRIFSDEQVRYRIDERGGVHFAIDSEFERMRISTVTELALPRYQGVRDLFEGAFNALDKTPPDGKSGIRSGFFAAESLFRLMFPNAHQLSAAEVQKHLRPLVDKVYEGQKPAVYLAQKQVAAFREWIDGAHFYRHEPGSEEPAQPPLDLAIYVITQAGGHLRWLAKLDRTIRT